MGQTGAPAGRGLSRRRGRGLLYDDNRRRYTNYDDYDDDRRSSDDRHYYQNSETQYENRYDTYRKNNEIVDYFDYNPGA